MKRIIIVLFSFTVLFSNLAYGATIYVDSGVICTGNYDITSRGCSGTDGDCYSTVALGIAALSAGDTLNIRAGTYTENDIAIGFTGPSMTTIQAYNSESVTINNTTSDTPTFYLSNSADDITIKDLKFTGNRDVANMSLGIGIGSATSSNGYIIVDNCEISEFAHCGIKGGYKWWVKNCHIYDIGQNSQDHGLYLYGTGHSSGNEPIIEYNNIEDVEGSAIDIYLGGFEPRYYIIRYNIAKNFGRSGLQLQGKNNQIYGNTFYGGYIGMLLRGEECHDNIVKNNLCDGNSWCDIQVDHLGELNSFPMDNTVEYNFYGSNDSVHGYCNGCTDHTGVGGDDYTTYSASPNILSSDNPFVSESPSNWYDVRLGSGSGCIDTGVDLGSSHDDAIDPNDTTWIPSTLDQDDYGSGWEIGAFVFREIASKPLPVKWKDPYIQ